MRKTITLELGLGRTATLRALPIQPSSGLYLLLRGYGDDERFCRLFHAAWNRIPLGCRRAIVKHWRRDTNPDSGLPCSPNIQLLDTWDNGIGCTSQDKDGTLVKLADRHDEYAIASRRGHKMFFYAPAIDAMPDEAVQSIIAHELRHVQQCAWGDFSVTGGGSDWWNDEVERDAFEAEEEWGFDNDAVEEWERSLIRQRPEMPSACARGLIFPSESKIKD